MTEPTAAEEPNLEIATEARSHLSPNQKARQRFRRNRLAVLSSAFLAAVIVAIVVWPIILKVSSAFRGRGSEFARRYAPETISDEQFQRPNAKHWFGTDVHGRD